MKWIIVTAIAGVVASAQMKPLSSAEVEQAIAQAQRTLASREVQDALSKAQRAVDSTFMQENLLRAQEALESAAPLLNRSALPALAPLAGIGGGIAGGVFGGIPALPALAFAPQAAADRALEQADRAREKAERVREARDRARDSEERNLDLYRAGTSAVDEHRYERAIDRFNQVIDNKWSRADGAYYWKAYALNKLGKRDEALAALAEIPKQFPQSRWINDADALKVEIQQASGQPVSPEAQSGEDLKLLAINSLMNSEPDRAVPLLEKLLNDPKNSLSVKSRALFVLAQSRGDKARDIVAQYAKNGSNPDLQLRAVQYLGTLRSKDSQQTLADIYAANSDVSVRRAVLRSMMMSRDIAHLLNAAKSEQNPDLRREAIRDLGMTGASNELAQLYSSETNPDVKESIIEALWLSRNGDKLLDIARTEKDPKLRMYAIERLSLTRGDKTADGLASLYANESDKANREQILNGLWRSGACKQLVDAVRNEKDAALKAEGVQRLGRMRGCKEASDYLMELINK